MGEALTVKQFKRVLPRNMVKSLSDKMVEDINNIILDPEVHEAYRDNLISYTGVLSDGRFKIQQYVDAVKYVSFKLNGESNVVSFAKTFPDRYQSYIDRGTNDAAIASYVTSYNKNKLVNLILEQTLVPSHVLNADLYQKALNVQADLMMHARSEKVKTDAANSILNQLKRPEATKIELDISVGESQAIRDLNETTLNLVAQQKKMMQAGVMSLLEVAESNIIEAEAVEVITDD